MKQIQNIDGKLTTEYAAYLSIYQTSSYIILKYLNLSCAVNFSLSQGEKKI